MRSGLNEARLKQKMQGQRERKSLDTREAGSARGEPDHHVVDAP